MDFTCILEPRVINTILGNGVTWKAPYVKSVTHDETGWREITATSELFNMLARRIRGGRSLIHR
jgi:hypothetical protein